MFDDKTSKKISDAEKKWQNNFIAMYEKKQGFRLPEYATESKIPTKLVYSARDVEHIDPDEIGMPGAYPYTRGIYPLSYQYTPWMNQMLHGFGLPEHTRDRINKLRREGMPPVLLLEIDIASSYAFDPDDPKASGMIGVAGVSLSNAQDMEILFQGFDLRKTRVAISTKMTCLPMLATYLVYGEGLGYKPHELNGQSQNRPKWSWIGENVRCVPPKYQTRLQIELIKYCTNYMPNWNHTNLCAYIPGENFASPIQEMGLVLAEAIELIELGIKAGLNPENFVPRFSSQLHMGMDFFEEIAKLRAYRKMWAKIAKDRFGCKSDRAHQFRIHVHTGGMSLTGQQPLNNITRSTLQVLASILGGTQSIHTCSYDEAISLPSEEAVTTALRVNQILLHESKIPNVTDPLGGSYYLEWLTDKLEEEAWNLIDQVESRGGFTKCLESNWIWEIFDRRMNEWRQEIDRGERIIVGVNKYAQEEKMEVPVFTLDQEEIEKVAANKARKWKAERNHHLVSESLKRVEEEARENPTAEQAGTLMPALINAARAKCTIGEMANALFSAYGCVYPY